MAWEEESCGGEQEVRAVSASVAAAARSNCLSNCGR